MVLRRRSIAAVFIFTLMTTWKRGRRALAGVMFAGARPLTEFLQDIAKNPPIRVPGTAVFMSGSDAGVPSALTHNLKHNQVLHERVILLTARTDQRPRVEDGERLQVEPLTDGFWRATIHFGFMEEPNVPAALELMSAAGLHVDPRKVTYFLGRETLIASRKVPGMALWREKLFVAMARNAMNATNYFSLPPDRVVELGTQLEI